MLLVDDLAAGGTKNLRHTPRGLVTLYTRVSLDICIAGPGQFTNRLLIISADVKGKDSMILFTM